MKLIFSNDWLKKRISTDPDIACDAGLSLGAESDIRALCNITTQDSNLAKIAEEKIIPLRVALGHLVHQLRRKESLSIEELAKRSKVSEDEIRKVEHDPHYSARPRFIFQLSEYFKVPLSVLAQISGATNEIDRTLYNEAIKYAAHSDDISSLSTEEREMLDAFITLLSERSRDKR